VENERKFADAVRKSARDAAGQAATERIEIALADLWRARPADAGVIAGRYIEWIEGEPHARAPLSYNMA
jgi:hypothetical protein